jgi:hypothetical protein
LLAGILRIATDAPVLDYSFAFDEGIQALGRVLAVMLVAMTAVAYLRSRATHPLLTATLVCSANLLALPISWEHHLVLVLPGLAYLWASAESRRKKFVLSAITALICLNWSPLYDEIGGGRVIANFPLFGNLILFLLLVREHVIYRYRPVLTTPS